MCGWPDRHGTARATDQGALLNAGPSWRAEPGLPRMTVGEGARKRERDFGREEMHEPPSAFAGSMEGNAKVERIADNMRNLEPVIACNPDVIAAQFMTSVGLQRRVDPRTTLADPGIDPWSRPPIAPRARMPDPMAPGACC